MGYRIGSLNSYPAKHSGGYTLIELIVVIALLSIMLAFAIPRFEGGVLTNNSKKVTRWFMIKIQMLKQNALKNRKIYTLHISPDSGKMWISDESMSEEDLEKASQNTYEIPEDIRVLDVEYPGGEKISFNRADINFYKSGYSDKVMIHIEDKDSNRKSLLIEPFLPEIKVYEEYVGFD